MQTLAELLRTKRVIVTVGAGGVGKTTTAAALAVAAAREGKRVLCLTIDPARRLAESLGIGEMRTEAMDVDPARFAAAGIPFKGRLTAMMLDTKGTFDDLVRRYSSSPQKAEALLSNKLYQYVSTSLAGTQEYMAMEKLAAVKGDKNYDLVVLDTPPTANALDFLDAPERLVGALDSAAMRWFVEAFQSGSKFSLNFLAKGAAAVLRGIGKITGGGFLESLSEFIAQLNDLFGGFRERAARVKDALRGNDVSFLLVTSPSPESLSEILFFADKLKEASMPRAGFVINRVHDVPADAAAAGPTDVAAAMAAVGLDPRALPRVEQAFRDAKHQAETDRANIAKFMAPYAKVLPVVLVAERDTDVHNVALLSALGDTLLAGGDVR
ncbi:MAG: ArsA-related P-loop ATPase [Polyangiaceae bacterium]